MSTQHTRFDVAEYLVDDASIAAYLDACLEEGGIALFQKAVGEVARARGMGEVAASSGVTRASLYKSLAEEGNPALSTMTRVIGTFGLRFSIQPLEAEASKPETPQRRVIRTGVVTPGTGMYGKPGLARTNAGSTVVDARAAMAPKAKSTSRTGDARSAKTGEFLTKSHAKNHPATTVVEHNRKPAKKGK
jgi:probable addiction module antidote protein